MNQDTLRRLQLTEFDMLCDFDKFCRENNLTYFLSSGTLLGAVRHKGFIPWDDDIDVTMPFCDYLRFLECSKLYDNKKYFIQTHETDKNWYRLYTRIRLNGTTMLKPDYAGIKMHNGIWIDIFPLIETGGSFDVKVKKVLINIATKSVMDEFLKINKAYCKKHPVWTRFLTLFHLVVPLSIRNKIFKCIFSFLGNDKGAYYSELWNTITNKYPKNLIDGKQNDLVFEGGSFKTYNKYKEILTVAYDDYMKLPPVEQRKGHDDNMIVSFDQEL